MMFFRAQAKAFFKKLFITRVMEVVSTLVTVTLACFL